MGVEAIKTDEQVIMGAVMRRVVVDKFRPFLSRRSNPLRDVVEADDLDAVLDDCEDHLKLLLFKYSKGYIGSYDLRDGIEALMSEMSRVYPEVLAIRSSFVRDVDIIAEDVRAVLRGTLGRDKIDPEILNLIDIARERIDVLSGTDEGDFVLSRDPDEVLVTLPLQVFYPTSHSLPPAPVVGDNGATNERDVPNVDVDRTNFSKILKSFGDTSVGFSLVKPDGSNIFNDPSVKAVFEGFVFGKLPPMARRFFDIYLGDPLVVSLIRDEIVDRCDTTHSSLGVLFARLKDKGINMIRNESEIQSPGFYLLSFSDEKRAHGRKYSIVYAKPDFVN